jgi:hypothetical protein
MKMTWMRLVLAFVCVGSAWVSPALAMMPVEEKTAAAGRSVPDGYVVSHPSDASSVIVVFKDEATTKKKDGKSAVEKASFNRSEGWKRRSRSPRRRRRRVERRSEAGRREI